MISLYRIIGSKFTRLHKLKKNAFANHQITIHLTPPDLDCANCPSVIDAGRTNCADTAILGGCDGGVKDRCEEFANAITRQALSIVATNLISSTMKLSFPFVVKICECLCVQCPQLRNQKLREGIGRRVRAEERDDARVGYVAHEVLQGMG